MNTDHTVHVISMEGITVVVDQTKTTEDTVDTSSEGVVTARGDELKDVEHLQKVAAALETEHLDEHAELVKEHMRNIVAKELNELDGFDR